MIRMPDVYLFPTVFAEITLSGSANDINEDGVCGAMIFDFEIVISHSERWT